MAMTAPVLEVDGLTAGYKSATVLRNIGITVGAGEVVALLGANGAGKSTTLRTVCGGLRATTGTVRFFGADITNRSTQSIARLGVVHMSDRRSVFAGLTVAEHFRLSYRGQHLDADEAYERFPALAPLRQRRAGLLSGGEQQMLGLARALARRPRLLLVDEFSLGLAPVIVQRLLPLVRDYVNETGTGAVIVEQHVQLALEIADRGYVLSRGKISASKPARDLLANRELLTESYLGGADDPDVGADPLPPRNQPKAGTTR